jgi:hypothetical protein
MNSSIVRTLGAGAAAGAAFALTNFLTFGLFAGAQIGKTGLLFDPATQSPKVIAVWKEIAPLPFIVTKPAVIIGGWILFGIAYAVLYRFIAAGWPSARTSRVLRLATVIWLGTAFSELMGPLNLLHEPLALSSIEFTFWALAATIEALTIVLLSPPLGAKAGLQRGSLAAPTLPSPAGGGR